MVSTNIAQSHTFDSFYAVIRSKKNNLIAVGLLVASLPSDPAINKTLDCEFLHETGNYISDSKFSVKC